MENIAEALRMAAGMVIAVLLIGLLVYMFSSVGGLENTKRNIKQQKEVTEFNKKFLAFDRSSMYGTDVISVIGLAISNNKIYNQEYHIRPLGNYEERSNYSINIEFEIPKDIYKYTKTQVWVTKKVQNPTTGEMETVEVEDPTDPRNDDSRSIMFPAGMYKLTYDLEKLYKVNAEGKYYTPEYQIYAKIDDIAIKGSETVTETSRREGIRRIVTVEDTSGFSEFKTIVFKCTDIKYNGAGRIYYMKFVKK